MIGRPHNILRDVVILTMPLVAVAAFIFAAAATSFHNAEIVNFSGYPVRALRIDPIGRFVQEAIDPFRNLTARRRYLAGRAPIAQEVPFLDLRVRGAALDLLDSALPASGRTWVDAVVIDWQDTARPLQRPVKVRHRGQRMENHFFDRRAWKIRTPRRRLLDGCRVLNLSRMLGRLDSHLSLMIAREAGIPVPRSRLVHLYVNMRSQGIYVDEGQVDESLVRRLGRMPGDLFYGEVFVPGEPKLGTDDIFTNPFAWRKKESDNRHPDEFRPHLTALLDWACDPSPASMAAFPPFLDRDRWVAFFALLTFQGDQHLNHSHNHKLYFDPATGRFEPIPWNVRITLSSPDAVESMANRLYRKLCRDPRFLDDVHRAVARRFLRPDLTRSQIAEIERIDRSWAACTAEPGRFRAYLDFVRGRVALRGRIVRDHHATADMAYATRAAGEGLAVDVYARAVASLRLRGLVLEAAAAGLRLVEDRDFDGRLGPRDRLLATRADGPRLLVDQDDALLHTGRDFDAPWRVRQASATADVRYTRLAYLHSPLLLVPAPGGTVPAVDAVLVERTVGEGDVRVSAGRRPSGLATETVHPWRLPPPPPPRTFRFAGEAELTETLIVAERDKLSVAPGTTLRLGPGVSIHASSRVVLEDVTITRLQPTRAWGVLALQGHGADGSSLRNCRLLGGSIDRIHRVDYLAPLSVHAADGVTVAGGICADNLLGDDTIRFVACRDMRIAGVTVRGANGDAIDCDLSTGRIEDVFVDRPANDGIDLMTANVDLARVHVVGAGDKGLSLGEAASPHIVACRLEGCVTGIAIKDASDPLIEQTVIRDCDVAVSGYDKNWRYPGGGRGRLVRCEMDRNRVDVRLDRWSDLDLVDCRAPGRYELPVGFEARLRIMPADEEGAP